MGIRPEDLDVATSKGQSSTSAENIVTGRVVLVERLGGTSHVHFDVGVNRLLATVSNDLLPEVGETIAVRVRSERAHLFASDGRAV